MAALAGFVALQTSQTSPPPPEWPLFRYQGILTNLEKFGHHHRHNCIFPTVFEAGAFLKNSLARWYLYYALHDGHSGIFLMYANDIEGPWTEYENNPVISNFWLGVPHVSSPDAIWIPEVQKLFVYFLGSNTAIRWAETEDGLSFTYGGIAVSNDMGGTNVLDRGYARVFTHPDPTSGYRYGMLYIDSEINNVCRVRIAESTNARTWVVDPEYVVATGSGEGGNVGGANIWQWKGHRYVIYHATSGKIYARTIDTTLRHVGSEPILLHQSSGMGEDNGKVAAPEIITTNGETYLFYESRARDGADIAWAKAV